MGDVPGWAYVVGAPLWAVAVVYFVRTTKDWPGIMGRWNERRRDRAQIESDQYERIAARCTTLERRCDDLEREVQDCHRSLADERAGRLAAEALLMGRQRSDQDAQLRLSAGRAADAAERNRGGK